MKSLPKMLLTAFMLLLTMSNMNAQDTRKYRVIAYKNGNHAINSTSNTTEVVPYMSIYIPNSFTPNGDGMNDTFGASGEAVGEYNLQIYNRWGQMIFESNNYAKQWDGRQDGQLVPEGSYVYKLSARGKAGNLTRKDGTVTVVY